MNNQKSDIAGMRGEYGFTIDSQEHLLCNEDNYQKAQRMFLDWNIINGQGGPGTDPNDKGSWHILCHLAGASALFESPKKLPGWVGITYNEVGNSYAATFSYYQGEKVRIAALDSDEARKAMASYVLRGYIEGASRGHILNRKANDPGDSTKVDRRQDYDQQVDSTKDGGPVWEHWTTTRDILTVDSLGTSLLMSYLRLVALLGGRYCGTVARGRFDREYCHVIQLCSLVEAGFIAPQDALWEVEPVTIPQEVQVVFHEANPEAFLQGATMLLDIAKAQENYYMYERRIDNFVAASSLTTIARTFRE